MNPKNRLHLICLLAACALPGLAGACMLGEPRRAQIVVNTIAGKATQADAPPLEMEAYAGDLVTVFMPAKAQLKVLDARSAAEPAQSGLPTLQALEEVRYQRLSAQGGGEAVQGARITGSAEPGKFGITWQRFGAARAGVVYLQIGSARQGRLVRIDILPARVVERGGVVQAREGDQSTPIWLSPFDTLTLVLPGTPGDGWLVDPVAQSGMQLLAIEAVEPADSGAKATQVRLRFSPGSARAEEQRLNLSAQGRHYRFILRKKPVPTC